MTINIDTVIAATRFGLGARPGELAEIGSSPRDWLKEQINSDDKLISGIGPIHTSQEAFTDFLEFRDRRMNDMREDNQSDVNPEEFKKIGQLARDIYRAHVLARSKQAVKTDQPFRERLVQFWSNHFAVSADDARMFGIVGSLEFEAIRPHISGYFSDMLLAVEKHPAMLVYLDNLQSVGPDSTLASRVRRRRRGRKFDINENLAREILELHTLGVAGGYTQEDVTTFAKVITGWSVAGIFPRIPYSGVPGDFHFYDEIHEPGNKTIMGRTYRQSGIAQGEAVLKDLAVHPATAEFIATKLARHFISDEPSERSINTLKEIFLATGGYLPAVYNTLIDLEESWYPEQLKYKSPQDYVYSMLRAIDFDLQDARFVIRPLTVLGQMPFRPGSPAGWPDTAREWSGGEALMKRLELASTVANRLGNSIDPKQLAQEALGPMLSERSNLEIARAESGAQGISLLFSSPEFQRR
jgi:uncharacterized protein (DUF1800 family)